ncbi:MAG: transglutaminase domain-containing protein [Victivallales bacterium]|nr:transglutaminase domain-containing protein [Victivallales bacterium]
MNTVQPRKMEELDRISWWLHLSYLCLFEAGVVSGMWQKVNSNLCFLLLFLGPVLMLLSRIPMRYFPSMVRQLLQLVLVGLGLAWFQQRANDCPLDIALIECSGVIAVALFLGGRVRELGMQALLDIAFAGYGGLTPGRQIYFPAFFATCIFYVIIMYQTRTSVFASMGRTVQGRMPRFWGNWIYRILHFVLVLGVGVFCLVRFPIRDRMRSKGLAPVSFHSDQDMEFPELWKSWFSSTKKMISRSEEEQAVDGNENPNTASDDAKDMMKKSSLNSKDAREGEGSSPSLGTDLVFRAYTPAKLYWVVQMYDTYNGREWTRSNIMTQGRCALDYYKPAVMHEVTQNISMEKMVSRHLPYAYKASQIQFRDPNRSTGRANFGIVTRGDAVTFVLKSHGRTEPPWHYRVQSFVPDVNLKPEIRAWNEPERNYGWNYRVLPTRRISKRVKELAARITEGLDDPRAKADALRDYLRNNYEYDLTVRSIPEGRETVDYFLFESKRGYCQHFAQALVVLARLSGLHARLVTGYSPGKFNVMANFFEVYEYHAHAWAQIFVPPFGWMTYDGVPPADSNLSGKQNIITSMLDPFGDKWNATPPELSFTPPKKPEPKQTGDIKSSDGKETPASESQQVAEELYDTIYEKAAMDNNTMEPTAEQLARAAGGMLKEKLMEWKGQLMERVKARLHSWKEAFMARWRNVLDWFKVRLWWILGSVTALHVILISLWFNRLRLYRLVGHLATRYRCWRLWKRISAGQLEGRSCISACQKLNNELLALAGFHVRPSRDLLEKGELFPKEASSLRDDYRIVAQAAFDLWYSPHEPSESVRSQVLEATIRFREHLREIGQMAQ